MFETETVSLEVKLPVDVLALLQRSRSEMEREAQQWVALALFRQRYVSAGRAAELASVSLSEFMTLTRQHGIPWTDYTDEELQAELQEALALGDKVRPAG